MSTTMRSMPTFAHRRRPVSARLLGTSSTGTTSKNKPRSSAMKNRRSLRSCRARKNRGSGARWITRCRALRTRLRQRCCATKTCPTRSTTKRWRSSLAAIEARDVADVALPREASPSVLHKCERGAWPCLRDGFTCASCTALAPRVVQHTQCTSRTDVFD